MKDQKLIDLIFELTYASRHRIPEDWTNQQHMEWVAEKLSDYGYKTVPMGLCWGVLVDE